MFHLLSRCFIFSVLFLCSLMTWAVTCPDPNTTSLQWGIPPEPWEANPFSPNPPRGEENTRFVRANILVAGLGRGVMCTYRNSYGDYSIWWNILTRIPTPQDYTWIATTGGYVCTLGIDLCLFYVADTTFGDQRAWLQNE